MSNANTFTRTEAEIHKQVAAQTADGGRVRCTERRCSEKYEENLVILYYIVLYIIILLYWCQFFLNMIFYICASDEQMRHYRSVYVILVNMKYVHYQFLILNISVCFDFDVNDRFLWEMLTTF